MPPQKIWKGTEKTLRQEGNATKMNASAYLKAQGWRGDGHSLDSNDRGIRRPLLVSKKVDVLGVGVKKHAAVSDQWWMRAYDSGLKDLGTGKKSTLATVREQGMYAGGLYGRFVKGDSIAGTFEAAVDNGKKRKRDEEDSGYESQKKNTKSDVEKLEKRVSEKVDAFIVEAERRGLIDPGLNKSGEHSSSKWKAAVYGEPAILKVFEDAGLVSSRGTSNKLLKGDKYAEKRKLRVLKKAAKAFVVSQLSDAEREHLEPDIKAEQKKAKKLAKRAEKEAAKAQRRQEARAAKLMAKQARSNERAEKRAEKLRTREEDSQQMEGNKRRDVAGPDAIPSFPVDTTEDASPAKKASKPMNVIDSEGKVRYIVDPKVPVPLDPSIWDGIVVKTLPKAVREARRQWMKTKRATRKEAACKKAARKEARGEQSSTDDKRLLKAERKKAAREELLNEILFASRAHAGQTTATVNGIENVPLVKMSGDEGQWTDLEINMGKKAARTALKQQRSRRSAKENSQIRQA